MTNTVISINKTLSTTDPRSHPVLIVGQLRHLSILQFEHVKCKLAPRVTEEIFQSAITCLHPSPTDFCPLYLDLAIIAALPIKCSRHNTSSRAHALTRLIKTHTMNATESILVCILIHFDCLFRCALCCCAHTHFWCWLLLLLLVLLFICYFYIFVEFLFSIIFLFAL